jgi:hypothetical protein
MPFSYIEFLLILSYILDPSRHYDVRLGQLLDCNVILAIVIVSLQEIKLVLGSNFLKFVP